MIVKIIYWLNAGTALLHRKLMHSNAEVYKWERAFSSKKHGFVSECTFWGKSPLSPSTRKIICLQRLNWQTYKRRHMKRLEKTRQSMYAIFENHQHSKRMSWLLNLLFNNNNKKTKRINSLQIMDSNGLCTDCTFGIFQHSYYYAESGP